MFGRYRKLSVLRTLHYIILEINIMLYNNCLYVQVFCYEEDIYIQYIYIHSITGREYVFKFTDLFFTDLYVYKFIVCLYVYRFKIKEYKNINNSQ